MNIKELRKLCKELMITHWIQNEDGSINVHGDVNLIQIKLYRIPKKLYRIPIKFNILIDKLKKLFNHYVVNF